VVGGGGKVRFEELDANEAGTVAKKSLQMFFWQNDRVLWIFLWV
jgi:hypothetical protein